MLKERVVLGAAVVAACLLTAPIASAAPPTINITSPEPLAEYLVDEDPPPTAQFTCDDVPEEGAVASCTATVDEEPIEAGDPLPLTPGEHLLVVTAVDDNDPPDSNTTTEEVTYFVATNRCEDIVGEVSRNGTVRLAPDCDKDPAAVVLDPSDSAEYDAEANEIVFRAGDTPGPVSFTYTADDAQPKDVTVEVGPCADVGPIEAQSTPFPEIGLPAEIELDCGVLEADDTIAVLDGPAHGALDPAGLPDFVEYTANTNYAGDDSFTYVLDDGSPDPIPATASITVTPFSFNGGGGDPGGGGDGGGSGGGGGGGGLVPDEPDTPGPGLPPLPRLPSLEGGGTGNIPTRFGRETGVTLRQKAVRANRRGRFGLKLRNANPFAVAGTLNVTGAYRKNRKGKRVPQLRVREPDVLLAAEKTTTVKLRLDRRGRRLLADKRKLKLRIELRVRDVEGGRRTVEQRFTLRAPKGASRRG